MPDDNPPLSLTKNVVDACQVIIAPNAITLTHPGHEPAAGQLTLKKENGVVKGFEYTCTCGRRDFFICE